MLSALVGMIPAWAAKTIGVIAVKIYGEVMARKDLKDSVRKELALAAKENTNDAFEYLARSGDTSVPVRDGAGDV